MQELMDTENEVRDLMIEELIELDELDKQRASSDVHHESELEWQRLGYSSEIEYLVKECNETGW
tara:strand:+ start:280 stop:471 length:192 start_codon:yes stop_codon:yes gene_type:complete